MRLCIDALKKNFAWSQRGYKIPQFDIEEVRYNTLKNPVWLHFGAGNIFRAFPAAIHQTLLDKGLCDRGIIACEAFDEEIIDKIYKPYDNLHILVALRADGTMDKRVIGSIAHAISASNNFDELINIFTSPSLQMVSFTITEKGYSLVDAKGEYLADVIYDFEHLSDRPKHIMGLVAMLCYKRYLAGKLPIALVSMDNFFHNGAKLYEAVRAFAYNWVQRGLADKGFIDYIDDPRFVSFPWSMIDKITPRPSEHVRSILAADGVEGMDIIRTSKNTYIAPFVNAEHVQYLVIEDVFPNSRPPLEKAGVIFTDRDTVDKVEKMKVCTCLNPFHTILAIFGCLLGYKSIADEMKDKCLRSFVEKAGYEELMPATVEPGIIRPQDFMKEVIEERLPNPFVPDTPQRIACDTSQKLSIRFGETLKAYIASGKSIEGLTYIPLLFAGWLRYLLGVDDQGRAFDLSPDPMLAVLKGYLDGISLGDKGPFTEKLRPILSDERIFGVQLYEYGLAPKVESMFEELISAKGAVERTLQKYILGEDDLQ